MLGELQKEITQEESKSSESKLIKPEEEKKGK